MWRTKIVNYLYLHALASTFNVPISYALHNYKNLDFNHLEQIAAVLKQSSSLIDKMINPHAGPDKQK